MGKVAEEVVKARYRTLKYHDPEVLDAIWFVFFDAERCFYLTGGVAAEMYTPPPMRRGNRDTDLASRRWIDPVGIGAWFSPYRKLFEELGHPVEIVQRSQVTDILIGDVGYEGQSGGAEDVIISLPNYSKRYFDANRHKFLNCYLNAEAEPVELTTRKNSTGGRHVMLRAESPVDLTLHKLKRIRDHVVRRGAEAYAPPEDLMEHLARIWQEREILVGVEDAYFRGEASAEQFHRQRTWVRQICDWYDVQWTIEAIASAQLWADAFRRRVKETYRAILKEGGTREEKMALADGFYKIVCRMPKRLTLDREWVLGELRDIAEKEGIRITKKYDLA